MQTKFDIGQRVRVTYEGVVKGAGTSNCYVQRDGDDYWSTVPTKLCEVIE